LAAFQVIINGRFWVITEEDTTDLPTYDQIRIDARKRGWASELVAPLHYAE